MESDRMSFFQDPIKGFESLRLYGSSDTDFTEEDALSIDSHSDSVGLSSDFQLSTETDLKSTLTDSIVVQPVTIYSYDECLVKPSDKPRSSAHKNVFKGEKLKKRKSYVGYNRLCDFEAIHLYGDVSENRATRYRDYLPPISHKSRRMGRLRKRNTSVKKSNNQTRTDKLHPFRQVPPSSQLVPTELLTQMCLSCRKKLQEWMEETILACDRLNSTELSYNISHPQKRSKRKKKLTDFSSYSLSMHSINKEPHHNSHVVKESQFSMDDFRKFLHDRKTQNQIVSNEDPV